MLISLEMAALNKGEQNGLMEEIRGRDRQILLGVTGGIASGKTTVARMLEQRGARLIDFDLLSRVVVEPGKPAWRDITACFGEQVLQHDKTLDRKKLAKIVFGDSEKRKKLERFVHPRIYEEFRQRVKEYAAKDLSNIIIQVVVPLLLEENLQHLFHKILLVYIPEEMQIERVMKRDRISREMALNILRSQLPIEEKRSYADFIVDNSGSLEETKRQVEEVWEKLKKIQKEKRR
jgi:dephospho-CoA kinase